MMIKNWYSILVICLFLLTGCNVDYEAMAKHRTEYAKINQGDIVIVAIQEANTSHYIQGITLAIDEINQNNHGLLGRPLKLIIEKDLSDSKSAKTMIRRISNNPKVSIVLGHKNDEVVMPASLAYEKSQILFFPPHSTTKELTSHGSMFTFRMLPNNTQMADQLSVATKSLGYQKIAIIYEHADKYRVLSLLFEQAIIKKGLNPVFSHILSGKTKDYKPFLSDMKKLEFDAVFISTGAKTASQLVQQMREMGINSPILGSSELNSHDFKIQLGSAGNKIIAPTPYNILADSHINQNFVTHYRSQYKQSPNANAALGYDSVMLFANKVEKAQTTLPTVLASTVRFSPPWMGVTGTYLFNKKGDIEGKNYFIQILNNEQWQHISATHY